LLYTILTNEVLSRKNKPYDWVYFQNINQIARWKAGKEKGSKELNEIHKSQ
jgi:hypothetical protein